MIKQNRKKFSLIMSMFFCLLAGFLSFRNPKQVLGEDKFAGWIPISSAEELQKLKYGTESSKFYLTKNIDMSRNGYWDNDSTFYGTLDGNGHCIKNLTSLSNGLFSKLGEGAEVKNLRLVNINIRVSSDVGYDDGGIYYVCVGGIAGEGSGTVVLSNCAVSGDIMCDDQQDIQKYAQSYHNVGGIIGEAAGAKIESCVNESTIKISENGQYPYGSFFYVGGIAGSYGSIRNCCNLGDYSIDDSKAIRYSKNGDCLFAGGIVGFCNDINNCYSKGKGSITYSRNTKDGATYALGGVVGYASEYTEIFGGYYFDWNEGKIDSLYKPVRLYETDRSKESSYSGWDFKEKWTLNKGINEGYPIPTWYLPYAKIGQPYANMQSGTYSKNFNVELNSDVDGAQIYYTTDGTKPTAKSYTYTKAITVNKNMTLKAIVVYGKAKSNVVKYKYKIKKKKV